MELVFLFARGGEGGPKPGWPASGDESEGGEWGRGEERRWRKSAVQTWRPRATTPRRGRDLDRARPRIRDGKPEGGAVGQPAPHRVQVGEGDGEVDHPLALVEVKRRPAADGGARCPAPAGYPRGRGRRR
jgi:hypothetical protein